MTHWNKDSNLDILARIILHKMGVTLSHFDWLSTGFSKEYCNSALYSENCRYNICYSIPGTPVPFNIYNSYSQMLEVNQRGLFDVFARSTRILVEWASDDVELYESFMNGMDFGLDIKWDNKKNVGMRKIDGQIMIYLITSVAQLNFFHWAMKNKVITNIHFYHLF